MLPTPPDPDTALPARAALAALERICACIEAYDRIHADRALIAQLLYDIEVDVESSRRAATYHEAQARIATGRVAELSAQLARAKDDLRGCLLGLAMLVGSARALCDRLDALEADELVPERRAVAAALTGECASSLAAQLGYTVQEGDLRDLLRRLWRKLQLAPDTASAAEKWLFERLPRGVVQWWRPPPASAAQRDR